MGRLGKKQPLTTSQLPPARAQASDRLAIAVLSAFVSLFVAGATILLLLRFSPSTGFHWLGL